MTRKLSDKQANELDAQLDQCVYGTRVPIRSGFRRLRALDCLTNKIYGDLDSLDGLVRVAELLTREELVDDAFFRHARNFIHDLNIANKNAIDKRRVAFCLSGQYDVLFIL